MSTEITAEVRAHMVREFRIATEDPDDHGVYQISKDSLRALLDALEAAEKERDLWAAQSTENATALYADDGWKARAERAEVALAANDLLGELDQASEDWAAQPEWMKPITPAPDYSGRCEGLAPFRCGNPDCPAHRAALADPATEEER